MQASMPSTNKQTSTPFIETAHEHDHGKNKQDISFSMQAPEEKKQTNHCKCCKFLRVRWYGFNMKQLLSVLYLYNE